MGLRQTTVEDLEGTKVRILITGATGFIGSSVATRLFADGHRLTLLKRTGSDTGRIKDLLHKVAVYDIDVHSLEEIIAGETPELIVHLATNYGRSGESPIDIVETNIGFPSALIDAALRSGLKYFINTDTAAPQEYTFYASTKKAFLHPLGFFCKEKALKVVSLKLEYVYGPGDDDNKFIPYMIKSVLSGEEVDASGGEQKRDFIHLDDVVDAYASAVASIVEMEEDYISIDIGSGQSISLKAFASLVADFSTIDMKINWGARPYKKNEIFDSKADITKAEKILGWHPKRALHDVLKDTVDSYRQGA